jgi:hypothetical protein
MFGANCSENSVPVLRFINFILAEIQTINGNIVNVRFKFSELPNDMKMLAFLAGELNNNAKFCLPLLQMYQLTV